MGGKMVDSLINMGKISLKHTLRVYHDFGTNDVVGNIGD